MNSNLDIQKLPLQQGSGVPVTKYNASFSILEDTIFDHQSIAGALYKHLLNYDMTLLFFLKRYNTSSAYIEEHFWTFWQFHMQ
jgi:hypothetical protein